MGAACCVTAREKTIPAVSSGDHHLNRNSRYSPTWSFRWENKGLVAGEDASVQWLSDGINSSHNGMDSKLETTYSTEDGGSLDGFQGRMWSNSPLSDGTVEHVRNSESDGEAMGLSHDKMGKIGGSVQMLASSSDGVRACSDCLKSLTERSSWSAQKMIANSELPVVAVLICGHVYHADCLEKKTSEIDKYDPSCPICTSGDRKMVEISEKALTVEMKTSVKRDRASRNQVVKTDAGSMDSSRVRIGGSAGTDIMRDSSSASTSPSVRPVFRNHFSFGSRRSRTSTEVRSSKRRGLFWTKSIKECPPPITTLKS